MMYHRFITLGVFILAYILSTAGPAAAGLQNEPALSPGPAQRITTGSSRGGGFYSAISANGLTVVFESPAIDLAPGHISGSWDTYAYNLQNGTTRRVSVQSEGTAVENPGDYTSRPSISGDGRTIAFVSQSSALVDTDSNRLPDIFVHDQASGTTGLISISQSGEASNGASYTPDISDNGRFVVFQSHANNLVSNDTNDSVDIFIRDRDMGVTELVSITNTGQQGQDTNDYGFSSTSVSGDGRYVAFSYESLPVDGQAAQGIFVRDRQTQTTRWVAPGNLPTLSSNGRYLAFVTSESLVGEDQNDGPDVYIYDQQENSFERVSVTSSGQEVDHLDIFSPPDLSSDGRLVVFESKADDLVSGDSNDQTDVFLHNRMTGEIILLSSTPDGKPGNGDSHYPSISGDGSVVSFSSSASNLTGGDENGQNDVFVRGLAEQTILPTGGIQMYLPFIRQ